MRVDVVYTAVAAEATDFVGCGAIVVDVLRATTSLVAMFKAGAKRVIPVATVEEALEYRVSAPGSLICGERGGFAVEGFDYGNSPVEFESLDLTGRDLVLTTTNGTRTIAAVREASWKISAALVNATAAASAASSLGTDVIIACAGTEGAFSIEDAYAAGLLAAHLSRSAESMSDAAWGAIEIARRGVDQVITPTRCRHLAVLEEKGFGADIQYALEIDSSDLVPFFDSSGYFSLHR